MINERLIRETMAKIREVGELGWDQRFFVEPECGTTHCFAGWALRLSGYGVLPESRGGGFVIWNFRHPDGAPLEYEPWYEAGNLLGLTPAQANEVFYCFPPLTMSHEQRLALFVERLERVTGLEGL